MNAIDSSTVPTKSAEAGSGTDEAGPIVQASRHYSCSPLSPRKTGLESKNSNYPIPCLTLCAGR